MNQAGFSPALVEFLFVELPQGGNWVGVREFSK